MAPLGPFAAGRDVMVAVSGGADSMALAYLLATWGKPRATIVDHGMRPGSSDEATLTVARLAGMGIPATVLCAGLPPGPAAAERARHARYALLLQACRDTGCPDLLLAHHAGDQAETVRMRSDAGSLPAGLAGMAAIGYREHARMVRPLLSVPTSRLRATLRSRGIEWVEDPTNQDRSTLRVRVRAAMDSGAVRDAWEIGWRHGKARARSERLLAAELTAVEFRPAGFALISGAISDAALSAVIWAVSGQIYPPPRSVLSAGLTTRSVHGVLIRPAGRLGPLSVLVAREPGAVAPWAPAVPGLRWDGRFQLGDVPEGLTIGALGDDSARIGRRSLLPSIVRRSLPALRRGSEIVAVPHLGFPDAASCRSVSILFSPPRPAAGAPFVNPSSAEGM